MHLIFSTLVVSDLF